MSTLYSHPSSPLRSIALTVEDRTRLAAQGLLVLPPAASKPDFDSRGRWALDPAEHARVKAKNERVARIWVDGGRKHGSLFSLCRIHAVSEGNVRRAAYRLGLI